MQGQWCALPRAIAEINVGSVRMFLGPPARIRCGRETGKGRIGKKKGRQGDWAAPGPVPW